MKEKKKTPAPNAYKIPQTSRVINGKIDKTQGLSFMSESEFLGKSKPGPTHYKVNEVLTKKKVTGFKIIKPKEKYKWKPVKTRLPGPGSHDFDKWTKYVFSLKSNF